MGYAKSEDTRRKLLKSTAKLLRTKGFAATGLSQIIAESGVPKGSLYHHFPGGKDELASGAVRFSGEGIVGRLEALLARAGGPIEAVEAFCDYYVAQLGESDYRKGCPLATVTLEAAADVAVVQQASADAFSGIIALLSRSLQDRALPPATADRLALNIVSGIEGAILLAKSLHSPQPLLAMREQLGQQMRAAIEEVK